MLRNELYGIKGLVEELIVLCHSDSEINEAYFINLHSALSPACQGIRLAWNAAAFSKVPDYSLKRYFRFHLEGIREILDALPDFDSQHYVTNLLKTELTGLIAYQLKYFSAYFDFDALAPLAYRELMIQTLGATLSRLKLGLEKAPVVQSLKDCLFSYLEQMNLEEEKVNYTFRSLFYFECLVRELNALCLTPDAVMVNKLLADKLMEFNFNQLGFFCYRQQLIKSLLQGLTAENKLEVLYGQNVTLKRLPENSLIYDSRWPSLASMLSGWLDEEIIVTKDTIRAEKESTALDKLPLNLSVAHLACLIRLFFEGNLLNTSSLADIFRFISRHYRTKRQAVISPGSLSKEFYSTSQVTAAVVRDMLLKMVARINTNFFPVWIVIGGAVGVCLGMR